MKTSGKGCIAAIVLTFILCNTSHLVRAGVNPPAEPGTRVYDLAELQKMLGKLEKPPEYRPLLAKYKSNIEKIDTERVKREVEFWKQRTQSYKKMGTKVSKDESSILAELQKKGRGLKAKSLDLWDVPEARTALVPTSDASARIFSKLLEEGIVGQNDLMSVLSENAELLSGEWIKLVRKVADRAEENSRDRQTAISMLYRAGIARSKYRPALEQPSQAGDVKALKTLLFEIDKDTGQHIAVRTPENISLMRKLADSKSPPEIRAVCARYAVETGERTLAEAICRDLLSTRFRCFDDVSRRHHYDTDDELGRARDYILFLMFYKLRGEWSFEHIYDLSRIAELEYQYGEKLPKGWISYRLVPIGDMEVSLAQSLIGMVREK